jgi:hypothetical protein
MNSIVKFIGTVILNMEKQGIMSKHLIAQNMRGKARMGACGVVRFDSIQRYLKFGRRGSNALPSTGGPCRAS